MNTILTTNLVAIIHLCFVFCWIGCLITEAVIEYYPLFFNKTFHHSTIRFHKWIDILIELPLAVGTLLTGAILIFTIEYITKLHIIKIFCSLSACIVVSFCIKNVLYRDKMLKEKFSEDALLSQSKMIMLKLAGVFSFFFTASLILGILLGYNRISDMLFK